MIKKSVMELVLSLQDETTLTLERLWTKKFPRATAGIRCILNH